MEQALNFSRSTIQALQASQIRQVSESAMGRSDVIPLWFGESDQRTDPRIVAAAKKALDAGEFLYAPNNGVDSLRLALSRYQTELSGRPVAFDRITVTTSGMQGLMISMQAIVDPGDHVLVVGPSWPNIPGAATILSAEVELVDCQLEGQSWQLDLDYFFSKIRTNTKALVINSPNNPTGWTLSKEDWGKIVAFAREKRIWIIADEVYARLSYDQNHAPSVLEHCEDEDLIISVNSFSKAWTMTGWRLGWIVAPLSLKARLGMITEYNIACAAPFVQMAGVAAIQHSNTILEDMMPRLVQNRALVMDAISGWDRVDMADIPAAFYAFIHVDGMKDSLQTAMNLVQDKQVGIAPGSAFGDSGEGYLRICFANDSTRLSQALDRMGEFFTKHESRIL